VHGSRAWVAWFRGDTGVGSGGRVQGSRFRGWGCTVQGLGFPNPCSSAPVVRNDVSRFRV